MGGRHPGAGEGSAQESWTAASWAVASLERGLISWQSVIGWSLAVVMVQARLVFTKGPKLIFKCV